MPLLTDDTIRLRALEAEDLDTLYAWENDTRLWEHTSGAAPFSRKQLWEYINTYDGNIFTARQLRMMIVRCEDNVPVGMIDLYEFDPVNRHAFIGIMVAADYARCGYARRALRLLEEYCRQTLGMHQLATEVACGNEPSEKLFLGSGFKICGRLRSWLRRGRVYSDIYLMQKMLQSSSSI